VLPQEARAGALEEAPHNERHEDRVVELARDRDEVRDQVERHREINEREPRRQLPARRDAPVGKEPLEEDGAVGNEPSESADVPPARADGQGNQERRVYARENDGNEGKPAHPRSILGGCGAFPGHMPR
jgi:hypothetical protein